MEKLQTLNGGKECGIKPPSTTPAYFVILHQSQGDGSKDEGILVANQDVSSVAPFVSNTPDKSKSDIFLSSDCVSKEITVTLDNNNMWNEFYRCSTEMVLTKQGRRMFPYCRYWISGLDPYLKYILVMDITPLDTYRYKWNGKWWEPGGKAEPHVLGRVFIHPESPSTGQYWMHQPVSFYKLKLTNNVLDQDGHIILHSMHRYLPRLHVVPAEKATEVIQLNGPDVHTFTFPQTEFIAVTAYQNFQITQLKIDCNPFAKGFREGAVMGRFTKESKPKNSDQDSAGSKKSAEHDDPESIQKLRELFRMSEYSDVDTENEAFNAERDFLNFMNPLSRLKENSQLKADNPDSFDDHSGVASPSMQPKVEIKQEPEDNYDYNKTVAVEGVEVKREESENDVTDEYSNSDNDYPILERHFAQFRAKPRADRKHSLNSPSGVAKAKLLKLGSGSLPMVYLEPCVTAKNSMELPDLQDPVLSENKIQNTEVRDTPLSVESCQISQSPNIISSIEEDISKTDKRKRLSKSKVNAKCDTPQTALSTSCGPKKKLPFLLPKSSVTVTPGNETPIVKKRGRPRKHNVSKVGRPTKKGSPIEAPRLCPDFNPDLEDVDGVLFVAFSSKEALDVHTGEKPKTIGTFSFSAQTDSSEGRAEVRKFAELERQLIAQLRTMRYRQVIHPALQQVGLKLNIVDLTMSIDLRYLGVELPLPRFTDNTRWDNYGLCAQASGFPFVSRTGKTTDYTKIKGWRDKFSMNTTAPPLKIEASRTEHSLKNLSAFCSDELDEYLENEAKLMGDIKGFSQNETVSSISYQLPTKSSSYVRTLDSVLKKQAPHTTSSSNSSKPLPLPTKKRKYTRKISAPVTKSKLRPIVPTPVTIKEKVCKRHSAEKKKNTKAHSMNKFTASDLVEYPAPVQRIGKLPVADQKVTVQSSSVPPVEENLLPLLHQAQLQSHQISLKPLGFSKAQMKLMELEECAVWEGKPRTLITEERADISLSTLITAQASLKNKPIYKIINKRTTSCKKEFCRLGCICSSLSHAKHRPTHCCRITCMLGCHCLKSKLYLGKDGFKVKSVRPTQEDAENLQPTKQTDDSPWSAQEEPIENVEDDHKSGASTTKKKKSIDFNDWDLEFRSSKSFPIWNRSDVENDPEPLCIPEKAEFVESKVQHHKGHLEKSKSSSGSKSDRSHTPSTVVNLEEMDPVYLYFDSMMTCARVRAYEHKAPGEKAKKGQCIIDGSDTTGKEHDYKSIKKREREMEDTGEDEVVDKRCRKVDNNGPTKLIEIMSDCSWEQDRSKILNIVSQHMNNREPQSFKVGSFNIELMSEKKSEDKSMSSTTSSRVKISMAPGQKTDQASAKPPVQWGAESVKLPDEKPHDICAEKETKSHGGKGLPFYTKVIPAGKLVARLKNSTINQADLIQVNGKSYPQAKLLLGQMGALHPANRLAAYITHRLRPSLFHLSKLSEINVKMAAKKPPLDSATGGNSKDIMAVEKTATSQQTNSAAQSTSTTQLTQFVKDEVGTLDQKSPGVSSPKPTIPGSPKLTTQSTRLLVTSPVASGKQAPVVAYSSAVNMTSFSPPSLSSVGLGTVSPIGNQAASSNPTLIPGTKLVTKDSSFSNQAVFVSSASNEAIHTMTLTSGPSTKKSMSTSSILPSTLVKAITPTLPTSTFTLSMNSGTDKSIATAVAKSLVTSTDVKTHGSVAPLAGTNIAPPMTLKTVTPPSVPTQRPSSVSPGFEKRLGPRLLLIPVPSGSPFRPVQCVQTSPGQKVVLQPIKSPNGANLFRHPNGQIIQLVPLQQVQTGNFQPSSQQVVIRKQGPTVGIRLPLPMKTEFFDPTSASVTSTSISAAVPIATVSKTSPIKSVVTIVPSNPSVLSQFGTLTTTTAMPTTSSEVSRSPSKVVAYTSGGHAVVTSNVIPLQSGGFPVVNVPPPTAPSGSPQISASKAIILMMDKPAVVNESNNEVKPLDNLLSPVVSALSEKLAEEDHIKCERLPCSEMIKIDKKAEVEDNPKASVNFVELGGITQSKEKNGNGNSQNKQRSNVPSQIKAEVADKSSDFDEALLQEVTKKGVRWGQIPKGAQSPITEGDQSPAHKSTLFKKEHTSLIEPGLACDPNQIESIVYSDAEQQILREPGVEVIKSPLLEQSTARSKDFVSTINQEKDESLTVDPLIKVPITDEKDIPDIKKKDEYLIECYSHSEDDSDDDDDDDDDLCVDVETVEELSEKINIARLKASAITITLNTDSCGVHAKFSKERKKGFKVNEDDIFLMVGEGNSTSVHRRNHTANERKRRNEMRDLFEELKNALGLHNLPKVSKSYILKQAIEEIEELTDAADTLIRSKTMLSMKQSELIKKLSNLSGKPKDVVLKKLEYVYAKQKAVEAERKKLNLEEDCTVLKAAPPPPMRDLFQSLRVEEEAKETLSSDTKKPIILERKPVLLSMETKQQQPDVSIGTSSLLMATTGQVTLKEARVTGQVTGIPPTLVHADLSPAQMQSGMSSVVIQLPGTIFKGIIGNSPVPVTLSSVPGTFSAVAQSPHESEKDDLSMMPKIVNVTSLANEAYSDLGRELGIGTPVTEKGSKRDAHTLLTEIASRDAVQAISEIIAVSSVPPRSILMNNVEESFPDLKTQSPGANLVEHLPLSDFSDSNNERSSKSDNISMDDSSLGKLSEHIKDSRLELELTKLSSAIDDAGLDPSELSDVIGDQEDTDETLTSLLNEIALLNQHLINDTDDLDSGSDFPGSDTASRCSVGKFTDGESSPFSFGRFKELSETKEKNISLSPLFLQLEEGEIQESIRHNQDGGIFETDATKEPLINVAEKPCGVQKPPVTVSHCQKTETTVTSGSDVLWKPMPKLAPLGLKSPTLTSDQKILGSLSMPTLASVAIRLNSPKTMD